MFSSPVGPTILVGELEYCLLSSGRRWRSDCHSAPLIPNNDEAIQMVPAFAWAENWGRRPTSDSVAETAGIGGVIFFSLGVWLQEGWSWPQHFLMLGHMFSGSLAWDEQPFLFFFFLFVCACWRLLWYPVWNMWSAIRRPPPNMWVPRSRGPFIASLLPISANSYAFSWCYGQRFLVVKGRAWEEWGFFTLAKLGSPVIERFKIYINHNQPLMFLPFFF